MRNATLFLALFLCFTIARGYAQEKYRIHADDLLLQKKVAENPSLIDEYINYEKGLKLFIENMDHIPSVKTDTLINGRRIIPVVVHIIHKYGVENISDAQIHDAIARLNIDYNLQNADTADTYPLFKARAADCQIEYRLATVDPNGNCTSGIVRHYDPGTDYAYFWIMKTYHWPTNKYMNVFAVNFIYPEGIVLPDGAFIGGMSPFPPSNTLSQALTGGDADIDGILMRHDGVGSIGTAENMGGMPINSLNRTFTHEIGHYLNLYHPFQNLMLGLLPASSGCHTLLAPNGDEVSDTPQCATANQNTSLACIVPGSVNSCTDPEPDMVENYMDYQFGYCTNIFTNGQKTRMNATLMNDRRNLWSKENLIATGVLDITTPVECAPIPDFNVSSKTICAGTSVNFTDHSFNGTATEWNWTFTGSVQGSSTSQNPTGITYDNPGVYPVTLQVSNVQGSNTVTKTDYIYVYSTQAVASAPIYEGFESGLIGDWGYYNENGSTWEWHTPQAFEGSRCLRINNFSGNAANSKDAIITPGYDLTTLNTNKLLRLKFSYAYAPKIIPATIASEADTAYDKFYIYCSTDCGKSWTLKWSKSGVNLQTTNPVSNAFVPSDTTQWRTDSINIHGYLSGGATNLRIKFEFVSGGGNNLYFDNIIMDNFTLSAQEYFRDVLQMNLYPNPAGESSILSINMPEEEQLNITINDVLGRQVMQLAEGRMAQGAHEFRIPVREQLKKGLYFINLTSGEYAHTVKFVVE